MRDGSKITCGAFSLIEEIGEGGMAQVWRGIHRDSGVPVAIKVITGSRASSSEYQRRFRQEVQAVAGLNHPGIVTVYDYGSITAAAASASHEKLVEGSPFLAMEYASSGSLRQASPTNWSDLQRLLLQLLDALAFAHARGIVHRDIKPDNILCFDQTESGADRKLTDFGIASAMGVESVTKSGRYDGVSAGTPHYMSPEQLMGHWRDLGPWTDLYSLGCMAWELTCLKKPFRNDNAIALGMQHLREPLPELEPTFPVPGDFGAYLRKMAAKSPDDRFACAADAIHALLELRSEFDAPDAGATSGSAEDQPTASFTDPPMVGELGVSNTLAETVHDEPSLGLGYASTVAEEDDDGQGYSYQPPPPLPKTWRVERPPTDRHLVGAGLGLFGLCATPFVGCEVERDSVWSALSEVVESDTPRALVIRGASGTGKTRLAEWMAYRAVEVGAATHLRVPHSRKGGASEGISRLLDSCFASWNLDRASTLERVKACLDEQSVDAAGSARQLDEEARALTEMLRPAAPGEEIHEGSYHFASPVERYTLVERQLARLTARRPLVLWVDDVQWGMEALALIEHLLDAPDPQPILILMTVRTDALEPRPAERLEAFVEHPDVRQIEVEALDENEHARFIDALIGLEDDLAEQVERRTQGNPLFAVQLIGDWVSNGSLEVGLNGFRLGEDAPDDLPEDIHQVWHRRTESVLAEMHDDDREAMRVSLELAATLGQHVDWHEWEHACASASVSISGELLDALVDAGLVQRERAGLSFTHAMLSESLQQRAREGGRLDDLHRRCAVALGQLYGDRSVEAASRRGAHLESAGDLDEALEPLMTAAIEARKLGDYPRAEQLLDWRAELLDALHLDRRDRRRVQNWWMRGKLYVSTGRRDDAAMLAGRTLAMSNGTNWHLERGHARAIESMVLREEGQAEESHRALRQARECFAEADAPLQLAECIYDRAELAAIEGDYDVARQYYEKANQRFRELGDPVRQAAVMSHVGYCWSAEGDYEKAREETERALDLAEDAGARHAQAVCWTHLGEIARFQDDWTEARICYERAVEMNRACGSKNLYVCRFNLALVQLATDEFTEAQASFEDLHANAHAYGLAAVRVLLNMGLAACAAGFGDWPAWDDRLEQVEAFLASDELLEPDLPWLAERAARLAARRGRSSRARRAADLAADHWRKVGEDERADEVASLDFATDG
jgi:serine/threonine protein kinase/tetratricopeptide (TPR) repeat protein